MSGFLRNLIVTAQRSDTSLKPLVPSLYADRGGRDRAPWDAERRSDDAVPQGGEHSDTPSARLSSAGPPPPDATARDSPALGGQSMHVSDDQGARPAMSEARAGAVREVRQPRLVQDPVRATVPRRPTDRDAEQRALGAFTIDPSGSDTASPYSATSRPRAARPAGGRASPVTAEPAAGTDREAARSRVQPLLRRQSDAERPERAAAAPSHSTPQFANRSRRLGGDGSAPRGNDVEIHIGRIEVTAAPPVVRAPPKNPHPSPSLSDYLSGRRGRRP